MSVLNISNKPAPDLSHLPKPIPQKALKRDIREEDPQKNKFAHSVNSAFLAYAPRQPTSHAPLSLTKRLTVGYNKSREQFRKYSKDRYNEELDSLEPGSPLKDSKGKALKGTYGQILTTKRPDVVIKLQCLYLEYKRLDVRSTAAQNARREIYIHKTLSEEGCPHIPPLIKSLNFESNIFATAMKKTGTDFGRLYQLPQRRAIMKDLKIIFRSILETLVCMHNPPDSRKPRLPIIHGDIKPANLAYSGNQKEPVHVIDFGLSQFVPKEKLTDPAMYSNWYRAPEVALRLPYGTPADIWALGCILFELFTGFPLFPVTAADTFKQEAINLLCMYYSRFGLLIPTPFVEKSPIRNAISQTVNGNIQIFPHTNTKQVNPWGEEVAFIRGFRGKETKEEQEQVMDLMVKMLAYDQQERITAKEALEHPFFEGIQK